MKQKRMTIIIYVFAAVIILNTFNRSLSGWRDMPFERSLVVPWVVFIGLSFLEPLISRYSRILLYIYLVIQTLVISYMMDTPPYADYFSLLYIVIILQALRTLPERQGIGWAVGITVVMVAMNLRGNGFDIGLSFAINYVVANTVIAAMVIMTSRAHDAREKSQNLLGELQEAHQKLQAYASQAEEMAVFRERNRLARDLHDSVTQSLYSLTLLAAGWKRSARDGNIENLEDPLTDIGDIAQQALKEMRLLVYELRPPTLEKEGLLGALHQRLGAVERRSGVKAQLVSEGILELPPAAEDALYNVAVEALNNTLKHAAATQVKMQLRIVDDVIQLDVLDNGNGFDKEQASKTAGMGMNSMRERVEALNGTLTIETSGKGTHIKARIPCPPVLVDGAIT